MQDHLRAVAVRGLKPWVGDRVWQVLRRVDRGRPGGRRPAPRTHRSSAAAPPATLAATAASAPVGGSVRGMLPDLDTLLTAQPAARVAVLADPRSAAVADLVRSAYRRARVTLVEGDPEDPLTHARLAATGPYDLIVDAVDDRPDPAGVVRSVLFHLSRGGHLALAGFRPGSPQRQRLWSLLSRLVALRDPGGPVVPATPDEQTLAQATGRVTVGPRHVLVRNATRGLVKLREAEVGPMLQIAGERFGTVLEQIEAERFTSRSLIRDHREETGIRVQAPIEVPELSLRAYNHVTCAPGQVVVKRNLLLPETYRHHLQARLVNRVTTELAPRFAQVKQDLRDADRLTGPYFHFDSEWPGHFGHVLSEQVSRLWGWEAAKAAHPDLRILLGRRPGHDRALPFERAILAAFDIAESDITLIDRPVRVEQLLAATPMFSMPHYVSPRIASVWHTIGTRVGVQADEVSTPRRFFVGRERATRRCRNEADVERVFAEAGFEIVFPEHLPFATQVAMFQNAEVVAGYAGSALFTLICCAQPKRVLMLSSESYTANNEYLIAAVLGHEFDVFWSEAEPGSWNAPFAFDFDREGRHLERVLAELGPG